MDGGSFNGRTIPALGADKVARIYYEVQTKLLSSGADYADLYDALIQACTNLIGKNGITSANCQAVKTAAEAVEMNLPAPAPADAPQAPICDGGTTPRYVFFDDLENPASGNWTRKVLRGANHWYYPQNDNPLGYNATFASSGETNFWGDDAGQQLSDPNAGDSTADTAIQMTRSIKLPAGAFLHFSHAYGFETVEYSWFPEWNEYYDGGLVEYSTDGGATWKDIGGLFTHNGYKGPLYSSNPLAGRQAFSGKSHGYIGSRADLSSLAGKSIRLRFRMGIDAYVGDYGWFVDDIRLYTCGNAGAANLVKNPGFELDANNDTRPDNWWAADYSKIARDSSVKHGGQYGLRLQVSDDTNLPVTQSIDIQASATYRLGGWVNIPAATGQDANGFRFQVQIVWQDANKQTLTTNTVRTFQAATSGWTSFSAKVLAPRQADRAVVRLMATSLKGKVYVDDLTLTR